MEGIPLSDVASRVLASQRPLILLGGGARGLIQNADSVAYLESLALPVALTWSGAPFASALTHYVGIVGQFGRPTANLAFHEADLVLAIGTRLPTTVTGQNRSLLMNKIIHVDIDTAELLLTRERLGATTFAMDASRFLGNLQVALEPVDKKMEGLHGLWVRHLEGLLASENKVLIEAGVRSRSPFLNSHGAVATLLAEATELDTLVIDGGGTALYSGFQGAPLNRFGNVVSLNAISSMGTAPGQMIGVLEAQSQGRVIGIIGDGSFVMALNALPSISDKPNAFLIVISNGGYLAIRHTQERFLGSRFDGTWNPEQSSLPSVREISKSLGFRYFEFVQDSPTSVQEMLDLGFAGNAATVIEVMADPAQPPFWSVSSEVDEQSGRAVPLPLSTMTSGVVGLDA